MVHSSTGCLYDKQPNIEVNGQIPFTYPFCQAGTNISNSIMDDDGIIVCYTTGQNMVANIIDIEQLRYHFSRDGSLFCHKDNKKIRNKIVISLSFPSILLYVE